MIGFVQISKAKIPLLHSVLQRRLPNSTTFYNIVHLFLNERYSQNIQTTFYSSNEIDDNSLFVAVQNRTFSTEFDSMITLCGPPNLSVLTSEVISQFEKTINWTIPVCFSAVDEDLVNHLKVPEMCSRNGKLNAIDPCHFYYMPIENALKFDINRHAEVAVTPLVVEDAQKVTDYWKFSGKGTLERMKDAISYIPGSAGVRVGSPDSKLVSWVVTFQGGSINALFTDENHRRKGYAKMTMEGASKFCAEAGLIPNVQIQLFNDASKGLMEEIGFIYSHQINWVVYEPSKS